MDLKCLNLTLAWTLIILMVANIGSALFANRHLWKQLRTQNLADIFKGRNPAPLVVDPPYTKFLNEQCGSERGRDLVTLLTRETRFCEKYDDSQECEWCALGKILHDCTNNRRDLEAMVRRYIDWDTLVSRLLPIKNTKVTMKSPTMNAEPFRNRSTSI